MGMTDGSSPVGGSICSCPGSSGESYGPQVESAALRQGCLSSGSTLRSARSQSQGERGSGQRYGQDGHRCFLREDSPGFFLRLPCQRAQSQHLKTEKKGHGCSHCTSCFASPYGERKCATGLHAARLPSAQCRASRQTQDMGTGSDSTSSRGRRASRRVCPAWCRPGSSAEYPSAAG